MTVHWGHSHQAAEAEVLPNLKDLTGEAEYYKPRPQRVMDMG